MSRKPYILSQTEIDSIILAVSSLGIEEAMIRIEQNFLIMIVNKENVDENIFDISNSLLEMARSGSENKKLLYEISFNMKKLAHKMHRKYVTDGRKEKSNRFLNSVSNEE